MPAMCTSGGCSMASMESSSRPLKKAHLLRWRPQPHAQRGSLALAGSPDMLASPPAQLAKRSTPRVRPSGAASHLDLFEQPAGFPRILLGRRALPPAGVRDSVGAYAELSKLGIVLLVLVSSFPAFILS